MTALTFEEIKQDRERASKWLLGVAWLVEFCAAGIGFYFAFVIADGTREFINEYNIIGSVDSNVRLAMLPFMIVGLVELTKIPLAYAVYHSRVTVWRILFSFTLIFLCILTTETVFTGMERFLNIQMSIISEDQTEQEKLQDDIENIKMNINEISAYNLPELEDNYNKVTSNNNRELNLKLEEIEKIRRTKINEINTKIDTQIDLYTKNQGTQLAELERQRDQMQESLNGLVSDRDNQINKIGETVTQERKSQFEIISTSSNEISNLNQLEQAALVGITFKNAIISSYQKKRDEQGLIKSNAQTQIERINSKEKQDIKDVRAEFANEVNTTTKDIQALSKEIRAGKAVSDQNLTKSLELFNNQIESQDKTSDQERSRIIELNESMNATETTSYETEKSSIEKRRTALPELENMLSENRGTLINVEKSINEKSEQIQVLRFAKRWGNRDSLADVTPSDITSVMILWFGSIAFIAAVTGTVIAFASFLLKDKDAFTPKPKKKARKLLSNSFRRLIINRRKFYKRRRAGLFTRFIDATSNLFTAIKDRLYRPVIKKEYIEKEVEIEKIVEVTKEIIRKEMVYVPFYSTEGGTLDISGQIKDMTNPEEIKQKISEITSSMTSEKEDE